GEDHYKSGRDALAAHDPTSAVAHLTLVDTREAAEWLSVALMMESRSASDQFVERAFAAAGRARAAQPGQIRPRADVVAALQPGDMVLVFLVGEAYTYAWAFDRDGFVGYQLPPPTEIASAVDRARAYSDQGDREGLQRIAEDLMPALLGPVADRLPQLKRLIVVLDGPLQKFPIGALPAGDSGLPLEERIEVSIAEFGSLVDTAARQQTGPIVRDAAISPYAWLIGGTLLAVLAIGGIGVFRRR
ncbi:MAG TPA: CHAT domain-containing protein, partial [Vicinamibacterales bacterium]